MPYVFRRKSTGFSSSCSVPLSLKASNVAFGYRNFPQAGCSFLLRVHFWASSSKAHLWLPFEHFLFLYKNLSDYGKTLPVILCIPEWSAVSAMNPIPLTDELFKKSDHAALEHPWALPFSFLAVGQIGSATFLYLLRGCLMPTHSNTCRYACISFDAFPKKLHVRSKTHVALVACGISHAHVKVIKIRFPVWSQDLLKGINVKAGCYLITDGTDYLEVGYGKGRGCHDSAEHPVVYIAVPMFRRLSVRESGVCFQDHKDYLCGRIKMFLQSGRQSDRPAAFAIHSNGNNEWSLPSSLSLKLLRYFSGISNSVKPKVGWISEIFCIFAISLV